MTRRLLITTLGLLLLAAGAQASNINNGGGAVSFPLLATSSSCTTPAYAATGSGSDDGVHVTDGAVSLCIGAQTIVAVDATSVSAGNNSFRAGRYLSGGTAPTCSSNCGTSPSITGNDSAGTIVMGATGSPASGFVVTFSAAYSARPVCNVWAAKSGMATGKKPIVVVTATTTITVTTDGTAPGNTDEYQYKCEGPV